MRHTRGDERFDYCSSSSTNVGLPFNITPARVVVRRGSGRGNNDGSRRIGARPLPRTPNMHTLKWRVMREKTRHLRSWMR